MTHPLVRLAPGLLPLLALAAAARTDAGPCAITFTSADTIAAGDGTYDGCAVTVDGATLTIAGPHAFASLVVRNAGRVTSLARDSLCLTVSGSVTIMSGSRVSVDGRGYPLGAGPGTGLAGTPAPGGSHGGRGGLAGTAGSGPTNGDPFAPRLLGSGGGVSGVSTATGGGAVRLTVDGELRVDGELTARGDSAATVTPAYSPGGAAGGSILVSAGLLSGAGRIDAGGGRGFNGGGGGGGGRIAIAFLDSAFTGVLLATGGGSQVAARGGAAGTIWTRRTSQAFGALLVNNAGSSATARTDLVDSVSVVPGHLVVRGGGIVGVRLGSVLELSIAGDADIAAGAAISVDGAGHLLGQGPGAGMSGTPAPGGGHGGRGGREGGATYGALLAPTQFGSGGGVSGVSTGRGGGALRLTVAGTLRADGALSARGDSAATLTPTYSPGGGAGGSLWITCGRLEGAGTLDAGGGRGFNLGGGGGGGRIAIAYGSSSFVGSMRAFGAASPDPRLAGAGGTVWIQPAGGEAELRVANNDVRAYARTELPDSELVIPGHLRITDAGVLSTHRLQPFRLTVSGDAEVETGAAISVDGCGHPIGNGPGAGGSNSPAGGGGHGGLGGGPAGRRGATYGLASDPRELGSGGGVSGLSTAYGGGALILDVAGSLRVDGTLSARGDSGATITPGYSPGGGSGGSLLVHAGSISGNGAVDAGGGAGLAGGGGGGGGRIALFTTCWSGFSPAQIHVAGGAGGGLPAEPGTVHPDFAMGIAAGPIAWTGAVARRAAPDAFMPGEATSDSLVVTRERGQVQLGADIAVDMSEPGTFAAVGDSSIGILTAGTWVDVHLVHFDSGGGGRRTGTVTFDTNILGVILTDSRLDASDPELHAPGARYPVALPGRGLDWGDAGDSLSLSADRRTLTLSLAAGAPLDHVRVLTAIPIATCGLVADAGPASAAAAGLTLLPPRPNPSQGAVALRFALGAPAHARLEILDVAGRRVATVVDQSLAGGWHLMHWRRDPAVTGVLFARLTVRGEVRTTRIVAMR